MFQDRSLCLQRQNLTHTHTHFSMSACHYVLLSHTHRQHPPFAPYSSEEMSIFPGFISYARCPPSPTPSYRHTQIHLTPIHLSPNCLPSQHLPHTLAISLSPKAPVQPHLTVPKWAASALALPGPSGAPDSCVSVCVCACACKHWLSSVRTQPAL